MRDEQRVDARRALDRVEIGEGEAVRRASAWVGDRMGHGGTRRAASAIVGAAGKTCDFTVSRRVASGSTGSIACARQRLSARLRAAMRHIAVNRQATPARCGRPVGQWRPRRSPGDAMNRTRRLACLAAAARRRCGAARRAPRSRSSSASSTATRSSRPSSSRTRRAWSSRCDEINAARRRARAAARDRRRATTTATPATPCASPRSCSRARRSCC